MARLRGLGAVQKIQALRGILLVDSEGSPAFIVLGVSTEPYGTGSGELLLAANNKTQGLVDSAEFRSSKDAKDVKLVYAETGY